MNKGVIIILGVVGLGLLAAVASGGQAPPSPGPASPGLLNLKNPLKNTPVTPVVTPSTPATAMRDDLAAYGYKQSSMSLYRAFQASVGLTSDGYPGVNTMSALSTALLQQTGDGLPNSGYTMQALVLYPWVNNGVYDGVNAPTADEWNR
jgi:murein L,D-transpeptidase YcbB/YkuD